MTSADLLDALNIYTRPLRETEIVRFTAAGVPAAALTDPDPVRAARVLIEGRRFHFPDELRTPDGLTGTFIMPVFDEAGGVCDLAAWVPATGATATWLGVAWALGQHEFPYPISVLRPDGAVHVFRDPIAWLRADRRGIVIVDPAQARWRLLRDGAPLIAQSLEHARVLKQIVSI